MFMNVDIHICVYVPIHIYMYVHIDVYACIYIHTYINIYAWNYLTLALGPGVVPVPANPNPLVLAQIAGMGVSENSFDLALLSFRLTPPITGRVSGFGIVFLALDM